MGFKEAANLEGFVRDLEGKESDLVLMVMYLPKGKTKGKTFMSAAA